MGRFNAEFINANKVGADKPSVQDDEMMNPLQTEQFNDTDTQNSEVLNQSTEARSDAVDFGQNNADNGAPDNDKESSPVTIASPLETEEDVVTGNESDREYIKLDPNLIDFAADNPFRKRDNTDEGKKKIEELANNIAVFGLTTPLLVNKINGKYILISGERRLQAVKMLGWKTVDCMVTEVNDSHMSRGMLFSANVMTRSISPFEMFSYIYELMEIYKEMAEDRSISGGKYKYIADSLKMSKRQLFKYISIMNNIELLSDDEREALESGELSVNKAYNIVKASRAEEQQDAESSKSPSSPSSNDDKDTTDEGSEVLVESDSDNDVASNDSTERREEKSETIADTDIAASAEEVDNSANDSYGNTAVATETTKPEISGDTLSQTKLNNINQDFIDFILTGKSSQKRLQLFDAHSKSADKTIHGALVSSGGRSFIIYPSTIKSNANKDGTVLSVSFRCFEVDSDTIQKREGD